MLQHQCIPEHLEGCVVVMADGDEVGQVTREVVDPADPGNAYLVVRVQDEEVAGDAVEIAIPHRIIHTVAQHEVIVGTTMRWLRQSCWSWPHSNADTKPHVA